MTLLKFEDATANVLDNGSNKTIVFTVPIGSIENIIRTGVSFDGVVTDGSGCSFSLEYSIDGIDYGNITNYAGGNFPPLTHQSTKNIGVDSDFLYIRFRAYSGTGSLNISNVVIDVFLRVFNKVHEEEFLELLISAPWSGFKFVDESNNLIFPHIITQVTGDDDTETEEPTSTNLISGNVKKLNLPFKANVVAVSIGVDPKVVGSSVSDEITGDYTIDVYPHVDEVLVYVAPDYGKSFSENLFVSTGQVIHPTIPNKNVYIAQNDGLLGDTEPAWGDTEIINNEVTFLPSPLYRPLANGFVKPTIIPI